MINSVKSSKAINGLKFIINSLSVLHGDYPPTLQRGLLKYLKFNKSPLRDLGVKIMRGLLIQPVIFHFLVYIFFNNKSSNYYHDKI